MPLSRIRTKSFGIAEGTITNVALGGTPDQQLYDLGRSTCEDTIGNFPNPNGLLIERLQHVRLGVVSGVPPVFPVFSLSNVKTGSQDTWWDHLALAEAAPSDIIAATEAASRTNPSQPTVDIPVDLIEAFQALPKTMKEQFERLSSKKRQSLSNSAVEFNFGFAPLARDLAQIVNYADDLSKRLANLKHLHTSRGLHRKANIWSSSATDQVGPLTIWSLEGANVECYVNRSTFRKIWSSMVWRADDPFNPPTDADLFRQAQTVVHGWHLSPSTFWEAMPWSWMSDYFGNVGSFLGATRNTVGGHASDVCVMDWQQTISKQVITASSDWLSVTPGIAKYETKFRRLSDIGLSAYSVPVIGAKQVVTMASIAFNRNRLL